MKKFLLIVLSAVTLASCTGKKDAVASATSVSETAPATPDTVVLKVVQEPTQQDSLLIAYEKTPCFGRCPVYEVRVYRSGFATYEGKNFTEKMGRFTGKLTPDQIDRILEKAGSIDYFSLKNEYNSDVTDLPSTYTTIVQNGEKKRIRARASYPDELRELHETMESVFDQVTWKASTLR